MLHAIEAPAFKSTVVAGVLALGAAMWTPSHQPLTHRLSLQAPIRPHALYLTAWADGDVFVSGDLQPMTFTTRAYISDGCNWMGTETLEPIDAHHFSYTYDETILECEPGAVPYIKTPRVGIVTVEE